MSLRRKSRPTPVAASMIAEVYDYFYFSAMIFATRLKLSEIFKTHSDRIPVIFMTFVQNQMVRNNNILLCIITTFNTILYLMPYFIIKLLNKLICNE